MKKQNAGKELYQQLRRLPWEKLWAEEVPGFDAATPAEREERVAVVRAVGVVFSESGPRELANEVRSWLRSLLSDPSEKVRRYAMNALPKAGAGREEESELLALLKNTAIEREKNSWRERWIRSAASRRWRWRGEFSRRPSRRRARPWRGAKARAPSGWTACSRTSRA